MKEKNKGGRPFKKLEDMHFDGWEQLDALIIWASQAYCCEKLGVSDKTLTRIIFEKTGLSYPEYQTKKKEVIRINLLKKQYEVAMNGNVSMLIWLGKNELGQSDKQETTEKLSKESIEEIIKKAKELNDE